MKFPVEKKKVDMACRTDFDKNALIQHTKLEREKRRLIKKQAESAQLL